VLHGAAIEQLREVVEQRVYPQRTELAHSPSTRRRQVCECTHAFDEKDRLPTDLRAEILGGEPGRGLGQSASLRRVSSASDLWSPTSESF
jgi:hypothetical protein